MTDSSTCSSPSPPDNGYFTDDTVCAAVGTTMYSGWACNITCYDGYALSGNTQCVGGVLSEATCEADATGAPSPAPISAPTTATCGDDSSWLYKGKSSKGCDYVAKKPHKYCSKDDGNDWLALNACQDTCGTCGCEDSDTWRYKGKSSKGCDYVAKKPSKYCDSEDEDGTTAAEACPMTCGNCGCQDSYTWLYKGKSGKDCEWVAKKPEKYCTKSKYKDEGGWKAREACRVTCETCVS